MIRLDGDDLELVVHRLPLDRPPGLRDDGEPRHDRGVVASAPGLYVVGRFFQTAVASSLLGWVGNDAGYVAGQIAARAPDANPPVTVQGR